MSNNQKRSFSFEYDKESKKLFVNIEHGLDVIRGNCDESYYGILFALTEFVSKYKKDPDFFIIGADYFDKQIYLTMLESETIKIVVTDNLTKEEAGELADEFINYYETGFNMTLNNLAASKLIDENSLDERRSKKLLIEKRF